MSQQTFLDAVYDRDGHVAMAEVACGYHFLDSSLLWEALQLAGSPVPSVSGRSLNEGNKKLANVGDAAIALIVRRWTWEQAWSIGDNASDTLPLAMLIKSQEEPPNTSKKLPAMFD